jgi:hypothetical protein
MSHDRRARGVPCAATLLVALALAPRAALACDVCAIYTATEMRETKSGLRLGVAEQYTDFATWQLDGQEIPNPGEFLHSSITQVIFGYNFLPRVGVQLNLPIISRTFRRLEHGRLTYGDETGVGDLSLVANVLALHQVTENSVFTLTLLGGLKLPSGDSSRLAEEAQEGDAEGAADAADRPVPAHVVPGGGGPRAGDQELLEEGGIHGHDLALGSGSVDGILGGDLFWSWRRLFVTAGGQWALRTEGDFGYRYADDLTWRTGPGVFVLLGHDHTLSVQASFSGETKGKDTLDGVAADDTALTALYLGPEIAATWGTSLSAEIAADLPVLIHNTALQTVPDYRLRGAVVWRF